MKIFKASLDNLSKLLSYLFIIVGLYVTIDKFKTYEQSSEWNAYIPFILFIAIVIICYGLSPRYYEITDQHLIINRLIKPVKIKLSTIKQVQPLDKTHVAWSIRTFGNGGLFGYYGKYYSKKLGAMTLYTTRKDQFVLIETNEGKKIVITPDDHNDFINVLQKYIDIKFK